MSLAIEASTSVPPRYNSADDGQRKKARQSMRGDAAWSWAALGSEPFDSDAPVLVESETEAALVTLDHHCDARLSDVLSVYQET